MTRAQARLLHALTAFGDAAFDLGEWLGAAPHARLPTRRRGRRGHRRPPTAAVHAAYDRMLTTENALRALLDLPTRRDT